MQISVSSWESIGESGRVCGTRKQESAQRKWRAQGPRNQFEGLPAGTTGTVYLNIKIIDSNGL